MANSNTDYVEVTEVAGEPVSGEQIQRLCNRYFWAETYCRNKSVLEVACGTGPGLGYLAKTAKQVIAGDYSEELVGIATRHYGDRISVRQFDAQQMPFPDGSFDVVLIFEALYYIPSIKRFLDEVRRVLSPGGTLLIVSANCDLYDFNPSPHSFKYLGVADMSQALRENGFNPTFFGGTPVSSTSLLQRILRPVKKIVVSLGLMPRTMAGKKILKRLIFGPMQSMPAEIDGSLRKYEAPTKIPADVPDLLHKVIFCAATLDANVTR